MSENKDHLADFSTGDVIKVHSGQLDGFRNIAMQNPGKKRYRLCLHDSPDNALQEMLICVTKGDYSRPHKHVGISESHHIVDGKERIILFDDDGNVTDSFVLDRKSGYISYRINSEVYHMSVPLTETVIKLEVKAGPFTPGSNIFPDWAPDGEDTGEAEKYVNAVMTGIEHLEN